MAVTKSISIFVAAGDEGAASCDNHETSTQATNGIEVNGFASTPSNVAVGGTDFGDSFAGINKSYWSSSVNNTSTFSSALSYVPEIPLNNSCASTLIDEYVTGSAITFGANGFCNSDLAEQLVVNKTGESWPYFETVFAGGGGPSKKFPKPVWQSGIVGIVNDGVRDLPDVSLFAGDGRWGTIT